MTRCRNSKRPISSTGRRGTDARGRNLRAGGTADGVRRVRRQANRLRHRGRGADARHAVVVGEPPGRGLDGYKASGSSSRRSRTDTGSCGTTAWVPGCRTGSAPADTLTLDYEVELLGAVVDELSPSSLSLLGISCGACASAVYAVRHPELVDRVVLYGAYANGRALGPADALSAMVELVCSAWGLGSQMLVDVFKPNAPAAQRRAMAAYQRAAATPETAAELLRRRLRLRRARRALGDERPDARRPSRPRSGDPLSGRTGGRRPHHRSRLRDHSGGRAPSVARRRGRFGGSRGRLPGRPAAGSGSPPEAVGELSERERKLLLLVAEGLSDSDIAERLVLSPHTVHRHAADIRRKLGLRSRSAAAAAAARAGLI